MLKIRLSQTGKRNNLQYRVVVAEARSKRDGKVVATLGFWQPKQKKLSIDKELLTLWISKGARATASISKLVGESL